MLTINEFIAELQSSTGGPFTIAITDRTNPKGYPWIYLVPVPTGRDDDPPRTAPSPKDLERLKGIAAARRIPLATWICEDLIYARVDDGLRIWSKRAFKFDFDSAGHLKCSDGSLIERSKIEDVETFLTSTHLSVELHLLGGETLILSRDLEINSSADYTATDNEFLGDEILNREKLNKLNSFKILLKEHLKIK